MQIRSEHILDCELSAFEKKPPQAITDHQNEVEQLKNNTRGLLRIWSLSYKEFPSIWRSLRQACSLAVLLTRLQQHLDFAGEGACHFRLMSA